MLSEDRDKERKREGQEREPLIRKLKPLFLNIPLEPNKVMIVAPSTNVALGSLLAQKIEDLYGFNVQTKLDEEVVDLDYKNFHMILLGNMMNNKVIENLYLQHYAFVDAKYPGEGGYVFHTIHNPFATGKNFILLGGSDLDGVEKAVDTFLMLAKGKSQLGWVQKTVSKHNVAVEPTEKVRKEFRDWTEDHFTTKRATDVMWKCMDFGLIHYQTGDKRWGSLFKETLFYYDDLRRGGFDFGLQMNSTWLWKFPMVWDLIEESPVFNDEERLRITNCILDYTPEVIKYEGLKTEYIPDAVQGNHHTFGAQALLFICKYFGKYYKLLIMEEWRKLYLPFLQRQSKVYRGASEGGAAYSWLEAYNAAVYAITEPDMTYFRNGNSAKIVDLAAATINNRKHMVTHGDCGGDLGLEASPFFYLSSLVGKAGWYYKDGSFEWLRSWFEGNEKAKDWKDQMIWDPIITGWYDGAFYTDVKPVKPSHHVGIYVAPVDKPFYDWTAWGGGKQYGRGKPEKIEVPLEKTFDKITFRSDFNPKSHYLMLDGYSRGFHGHDDGNAIIQFSAEDRVFLVDGDYIRSLPRYHNTVTFTRDGKSYRIPAFVKLDHKADFQKTGFTRTSIANYGGLDWDRNIIWLKDKFFLVIDNLNFKEWGEYLLRCIWRTAGEVEVDEGGIHVSQKGKYFHIYHLDEADIEENEEYPQGGKYYGGYRYANYPAKAFHEVMHEDFAPGEGYCYINMLEASLTPVQGYRIKRVAKRIVKIRDKEGNFALAGLADEGYQSQTFFIKAKIFYLSRELFALSAATLIKLDENYFMSNKPVNMEFDIPNRRCVIEADEKTEFSFYAPNKDVSVKIDNSPVATNKEDNTIKLQIDKGKHTIHFSNLWNAEVVNTIQSSLEKIPEIYFPKFKMEKIGEENPLLDEKLRVDIGDPVTKIATTQLADGEERFITGTQNGRILFYNLLGQKEWEYDCSGKVNAISCADIDKDGNVEILIGAGDELVILNQNGKRMQSYKFEKYYNREGNVQFVYSTDLEGDGESSIICGTDAWHVYAFDSKGEKRWVTEVYAHSTTVGAAADLDADGKKEVVVGTEYHTPINVFNSKGKPIWRSHKGQNGVCLELADLNGDGKTEVLYGTAGTTQYEMAHLFLFTHDGKLMWEADLGDEATCLTVKDINDDGLPEIIAGSKSWNLILLNTEGKILWRRFLGHSITALTSMHNDRTNLIVAGTDGGAVFCVDSNGNIVYRNQLKDAITDIKTLDYDNYSIAIVSTCGGQNYLLTT